MAETTALPQPITAKELAAYLRVDERRVYEMANAGRIPYYEVGGRKRYVAAEVLEALRREPSRPNPVVELDSLKVVQPADPSHLKVRTMVPL
jgi:excisionase family DNA binding protein